MQNSNYRPVTWRRADVLTASLVLNVLALALPFVILQVYDRIIPNQAEGTFMLLIVGLVVVALSEFVLRVFRSYILGWEASRFEHSKGLDAMEHILHIDCRRFEEKPDGFFLDRIAALDEIQRFYSGEALLLAVDLPFVIIFFVTIWLIAGTLVIIPAALLLMLLLTSLIAGSRLYQAINKRQEMSERRQNFLIEVLQGIHTVKSMAMEPFMMRRHERLQKQSAESVHELARINSLTQGIGASFSQLSSIGFVGFGSVDVIHGNLSIGALAAGTMLTGRILQPGLKAMGLWTQYQSVRHALKRVGELSTLPHEISGQDRPDTGLQGEYRLQNVRFSYEKEGPMILDGVSIRIAAGETIAITGSNGCGKSTLIKLLGGFIHPNSGQLFLDGKEVSSYDMAALRSRIALMPQKGILFEGTILENMTLYREGEATDQALEISRELGLEEIISRMPDGLDTRVGGGGNSAVPEGVRQKIVMVRSLVGNPDILLFDDANANLDMKNDRHLMQLIRRLKGKITMILVTHRPSYINLCDRSFILMDGKLQQYGDEYLDNDDRRAHKNDPDRLAQAGGVH